MLRSEKIAELINVRNARPEDFEAIGALRRQAFPLLLSLLMRLTMSRQALVAEGFDGRIAGAVTFKFVTLSGKRLGVGEWALVDPQHQGTGIGKALLGKLLEKFQVEGCDFAVTTDVDGYNSSSWNLGRAFGLNYWSLGSQVREFGWRLPELWWKIPHIAPGAFLLRQGAVNQAEPKGAAALVAVIGWVGFFLLPLSLMRETLWEGVNRERMLAPLTPRVLLTGAAVVTVYMVFRFAAQWLAARALKLPLIFRAWETGLVMATVLAVLFSAFIPAFAGSVYVNRDKFNYARARPQLGKIMLAAVAVSLALLFVCTVWAEKSGASPLSFGGLGRFVGISFGITDTLFFFAPFQAAPAGHLWLWSRAVWAMVVISFLTVWLLPNLFELH